MSKQYFNGKAILARYEATALTSGGYIFDTKNEKIKDFWEEWKHFNNFDDLLYTMVENNSIYGKTVYAIEKLGANNIAVVSHNYLQSADISSDCVGKPQVVKANIQLSFDKNNYKIDRYYTPDETYSIVWNDKGDELSTTDGVYILDKELQIQKQYKHNLGVCPIVLSYNLPYKTEFYNAQNMVIQFNGSTDTTYSHSLFKYYFQADTTYAEPIEKQINDTLECYSDELVKSESMIMISGSTSSEFLQAQNATMDPIHKEYYSKKGYLVNINDREANVSFKQNPNTLPVILDCVDGLISFYFSNCGLSFPSFSGGNNKHSTEIKTSMIQTLQTHKVKRHNIEKCVKELFYKSCLMYGFSEEDACDFLFQIKELNLDDELTLVQSITMAIQGGICDKKTGVMKYLDVSSDKADELVENIEQEQQAQLDQQKELAMSKPQGTQNQAGAGSK